MKHEENVTAVKAFLSKRTDDAWSPKEIAKATDLSVSTVKSILRMFLEQQSVSKKMARITFVKLGNGGFVKKSPETKVFQQEIVNPVAYYYWNVR